MPGNPKHATADDPYGTKWLETKTIESGPFIIENWQKGAMMSLVPNPRSSPPNSNALSCRLSLMPRPGALSWNVGHRFRHTNCHQGHPGFAQGLWRQSALVPSARGWWLGMTWNKAPFNNIHFRRAMAWAMPYETLLQVVTQGLAERSRSCVPNNVSGYVADLWPMKPIWRKPEELAQAQVPEGFTVTLPVYAGDLFDEEAPS